MSTGTATFTTSEGRTYTPTGTRIVLPVPTFTDPAKPGATLDAGSGWFNTQDAGAMYVPVQGCTYPNAWAAVGVAVPPACTGT